MQSAVAEGVFPGAVLLVRFRGAVAYERAFGVAASLPVPESVSPRTIYDLASLTKPLATTTALICLAEEGRLDLTTPLQALLPELKDSAIGQASVGHLLSHRAGLPAWRPYYERLCPSQRREPGPEGVERTALGLIREESLEAPIGVQCRYSDLGFMLLGFVIGRVSGMSLAHFCRERVFAPLGIDDLFFLGSDGRPIGRAPDGVNLSRIAPTEKDPWRGRMVRGEVHDENAYALGGVAGHSGLFGTASAVSQVSGCWLSACLGRKSLLSPEWVTSFLLGPDRRPGCSWVYGWDTPSRPSSSGTYFSLSSFGHLGFTGTSLWVDPGAELEVILLSNRVHPTRTNEAIRAFRPKIHDLIYQEFVARSG